MLQAAHVLLELQLRHPGGQVLQRVPFRKAPTQQDKQAPFASQYLQPLQVGLFEVTEVLFHARQVVEEFEVSHFKQFGAQAEQELVLDWRTNPGAH